MKAILLTICVLGISGMKPLYAEGPGRAPGMMDEKGPHMGPPDQKIDPSDIKFEYDSKSDLFKSADEARDYQSLFDKYKTSKEITDHFTKITEEKKAKIDEMRKSGKRPDMAKMKEERDAEKFSLIKEIKIILDKKKQDNIASLALNEDVKCGGGKNLPVIEASTTASMKDTAKVTKIILTEEELVKMKKDIKDEVKKEMMKEMAENKPKDESRGEKPGRDFKRDDEDKSGDREDRPKMAEGKGKKQMQGGRGGMGGGQSESGSFSMAGQMAAQMGNSQMGQMNQMGNSQMGQMNQMGNSQMGQMNQMGNSQMGHMNQMGNSQMGQMNQMNNNQMTRDQMIQNQIRPPQMTWSQQTNLYGNSQNMPQMNNNQMGQSQMRRPPMMNQNQNYGYQQQQTQNNYGYPQYAYQSNTDQNYGMMMNSQSSYNLMAPQMDYGYTGSNSSMPSAYSGYMNQQNQAAPSYTQYSFMGY